MAGKHREKANSELVRQRVDTILQLKLSAYTRMQILQYCSENKWKICERSIDKYIFKAEEVIHSFRIPKQKGWVEQASQMLLNLYKDSHEANNIGECRRILETMNKIFGYEKVRIESDIKLTEDIKIQIIETNKEAEELLDIIRQTGTVPGTENKESVINQVEQIP